MWDTSSFVVGIFVGLLLMIILLWISYASRIFVFTTTPRDYPECRSSQYFNNPSNAINDGFQVSQILAINSNNQMEYRRVPKSLCVPGDNQTVIINNPQYCLFTATKNGEEFTFEAKNPLFELPFYVSTSTIDGDLIEVTTEGDCNPQFNTHPEIIVTSGIPLLQWD